MREVRLNRMKTWWLLAVVGVGVAAIYLIIPAPGPSSDEARPWSSSDVREMLKNTGVGVDLLAPRDAALDLEVGDPVMIVVVMHDRPSSGVRSSGVVYVYESPAELGEWWHLDERGYAEPRYGIITDVVWAVQDNVLFSWSNWAINSARGVFAEVQDAMSSQLQAR